VARHGRARVSLPGGCAIGARPIDQHLKGLEALGVTIRMEHGYVVAETRRPVGGRVNFDLTTVTGTENVLMAAVLARGETVIESAACEPEVKDLADALVAMGAKIEGAGTETIRVQGVDRLRGTTHRVMPDRIETGTLIAAAGMTRGNVLLRGADPAHLASVIGKMETAGVRVTPEADGLRAVGPRRPRATDFKTAPYPGFATDMQAQMMAMMTVAEGMSVVTETIFENRFMHVLEMQRLGADIRIEGRSAVVRGRTRLSGAPVMATDLRASASLVLAALIADGVTEVSRVYHLDRGYERLDDKLSALGADIRRIPE
jgi:UDP-N-acetylglucosamine 1-carboxyvinyltransferase